VNAIALGQFFRWQDKKYNCSDLHLKLPVIPMFVAEQTLLIAVLSRLLSVAKSRRGNFIRTTKLIFGNAV